MTLSDAGFKQTVDLIWSLEGGTLTALSLLAEPLVRLVRTGTASQVITPLELTEDSRISLVPRLSDEMGSLLSVDVV